MTKSTDQVLFELESVQKKLKDAVDLLIFTVKEEILSKHTHMRFHNALDEVNAALAKLVEIRETKRPPGRPRIAEL